jgi:hypothetical protein
MQWHFPRSRHKKEIWMKAYQPLQRRPESISTVAAATPVQAPHASTSVPTPSLSQSFRKAASAIQQEEGDRHVVQQPVRLNYSLAHIPISPTGGLKVGAPNDSYEQEADRAARHVVASSASSSAPHAGERQPPRITQLRSTSPAPARLQRNSIVQSAPSTLPVPAGIESTIQHATRGGQILDERTRRPMERALGADFSAVRIHTDATADRLNRRLRARAFTLGGNIFFRRGAYRPTTSTGQQLLAHELTHVLQQGGSMTTLQRSFLPLQEPDEENRDQVIESYLKVIDYRYRAGEFEHLEGVSERMPAILGTLASNAPFEKKWQLLSAFVNIINKKAAESQSSGSGPVRMKPEEEADIMGKIKEEMPATGNVIDTIVSDDALLKQVFSEQHAQQAKENFGKIKQQLGEYKEILPDREGTIAAGGTVLLNEGNKAQREAKMHVTRLWGAKELKKRLSALVHEASHGSAVGTRDLAYLDSWSIEGLKGEEALRNAPHYEMAAEMKLGLRQSTKKELEVRPPEHEPQVRMLLAGVDNLTTQARLATSFVSKKLGEMQAAQMQASQPQPVQSPAMQPNQPQPAQSPTLQSDQPQPVQPAAIQSGQPQPGAQVDPLVSTIGHMLELPFLASKRGRVTNADLEMVLMYRSMLQKIHERLSQVKGVGVKEGTGSAVKFSNQLFAISAGLLQKPNEAGPALLQDIAKDLPVPDKWKGRLLIDSMGVLAEARRQAVTEK